MKKSFTLKFYYNIYQAGNEQGITSVHLASENKQEMKKAPEGCVEYIMNFARAYSVKESQSAGKVEMMLN